MIPTTTLLLPFRRAYLDILSQARYIWLALLVISVLISMPSLAIGLRAAFSTTPPIAIASPAQPQPTASVPVAAPAPIPPNTPAPPAAPSVNIAAPQACTAPTYNAPLPIDLSYHASGLTQVIDATMHYQVYGNTAAQIKAQLLQCTPRSSQTTVESGSFAAQTSGSLSWQYTATSDNSGTCTIGNVKVGLHITMILPAWQPTATATNGLASGWQGLISSLTTHENGHVAIYQQYANQLLTNLQSLPASPCASTASTVAAKVAADIAALDAANAGYDNTTNHGVAQGAVLH